MIRTAKQNAKVQLRMEKMALGELHNAHSYMFFELSRKDERSTMIFTRELGPGKPSKCEPAVGIKLVAPEASVLGAEILAMRKRRDREAKAGRKAIRLAKKAKGAS